MMPLRFLLAALLVASPVAALAAPGDSAPPAGDDDDDDDDDKPAPEPEPAKEEPAKEEPTPEEPAEEAPAKEEPAEEPAKEEPADDGADEDLDKMELPKAGSDSAGKTAPTETPSTDDLLGDDDDDDDEVTEETTGDEEISDAYRRRAEREARRNRGPKKKSITKVIQRKFFLKYRRVELVPHIGYVGNDHFIRRLELGLDLAYHVNDILGFEVAVGFMPNLKETDYKPLVAEFKTKSEVVPDISRVTFYGLIGPTFSPIYGKIELGTLRIINYDVYFFIGAGIAHSVDDTAIVESPCDGLTPAERKQDTANGCQYVDQNHFITGYGGGFRIVFNEWIGVRLDVRNMTHIEQAWRAGDVGLEMKHNLLLSFGASIFLPPKPRSLSGN